MKIVYLKPSSHISPGFRSDTLWGLICWGIRMLYSEGKLLEFLGTYRTGAPAMVVSSAFRYKEANGGYVRYYPKPFAAPVSWEQLSQAAKSREEKVALHNKLKAYKRVSFLDEARYFSYLNGSLTEADIFKGLDSWESELALAGTFQEVDIPHNRIDRLSGTTGEDALYSDEAVFANNGGLFFLVRETDGWGAVLEAVCNFYTHLGFGGNASTGYNHCTFTVEDFSFPAVTGANAFSTLSLYIPEKDETGFYTSHITNRQGAANLLWYEIEERKGKAGGRFIVASKFWKKSFFAFKEGSVFPEMNKPVYGSVQEADLQNSNELGFKPYQYGIAFAVPVKLQEPL